MLRDRCMMTSPRFCKLCIEFNWKACGAIYTAAFVINNIL